MIRIHSKLHSAWMDTHHVIPQNTDEYSLTPTYVLLSNFCCIVSSLSGHKISTKNRTVRSTTKLYARDHFKLEKVICLSYTDSIQPALEHRYLWYHHER